MKRPPPGYLEEHHGQPLLDLCVALIFLESLCIGLLYAARFISRDSNANNRMIVFMTLGYFVCMGKITIAILMIKIGGAGHHLIALPYSNIANALKLQTALQIVCPLATSISKLAVCFFFLQIFGRTSHTYRWVIRITFVLVLAILLVEVLIPFTNCKPFKYTWDKNIEGKCAFDGLALWRYLSVPNIVTTAIMVTIPVPALWKLQVSLPTKMGLGVVFSVCLLGIVAAILRFQAFLTVSSFNDITYDLVRPLMWTVAESGIYLIAGILPCLHPIARILFKRVHFKSWSLGRSQKSEKSLESRQSRESKQLKRSNDILERSSPLEKGRNTQVDIARISDEGLAKCAGESISETTSVDVEEVALESHTHSLDDEKRALKCAR